MTYKDFSSEIVESIRNDVESYKRISFMPFDPQVDFSRITYSPKIIDRKDTTGYFLDINSVPVGFSDGAFGNDADSVFAYCLISFPESDLNYEFIAYKYNPDKFFLFKNGRLTGCLNGEFAKDLSMVNRWKIIVDDKISGIVDVPVNLTRDNLEVEFKDGRESMVITVEPPPKYTDFLSALNYQLRRAFGLSPVPSADFVFLDTTEFYSLKEAELYFCSFVFFRVMVFC